ncbi:conserved Plasmodium protein, unknown function [Plasmodium gallinaceum]|uniref:Condensin-2 complex subunit G2 n=1 Tax=Plasmodium gallinaceum TaxID=5849 RepID=A0A1J1GQ69_PLAGA|nr:conserved Plasmodium protein, unknown function [Plasmodium gallinaceum]CRG94677.1 conserved Plasmodium protein, unknown function [Plasmodium gallinaceum]
MYQKIISNINELSQFKLICRKKSELLNIWKSCKSKEIEEIWLCLLNLLVENISPDKLIYSEENSTLLFREENNRQFLLTCINFISIYLQYLSNNEGKKSINLDENFRKLFYKLIEIQFMLSDKEVRISFGKCLLNICELKLIENEFSDYIKVNVLLFLLWKSCSTDGKISDINKLKKYKDFCKIIKWGISDKTTNSFYILCSYSLSLPKFYENCDGKIFLSYVWSLNENIAYHLFNKFVNSTVVLPYDNINHYSKIIYSTWKNCSDDMRSVLETQLEYLVHFSLKCPIKIAARFRCVLDIFNTNKGDKSINQLIFKIYDPVIWRNLMSPNWKIRFNATCIFQLIFPVVDPCIKDINYLEEMDKAYNALIELSEDKNTCVRQATAKCICYILNELWEIIHDDKRIILLDILINKSLKDKYNENVRTEAVLGLYEIAKNKMINKIFIKIFDKIKNLINDKSISVRKNFVNLVLELNKNLNNNFSNQIDFNELIKRITKDYITYNVQSCIKKLSYMKHGNNEKTKNKEIREFLKLSTNLITYNMWECDIKEQAKKCINFLNEYPVLMICISKFSTNLKLINRYKLSSVLFEITNVKLKEEDSCILLSENDKNILNDENIKKKYIRYSSLLICIANLLKAKNEEEMELCSSEEIQDFLKKKFLEKYFLDSINTMMQPFYFKVLKYINLNHDNYLIIHKYNHDQLNSLHTIKNKNICKKCIIPLFYKWGLLKSYICKHINFLNLSIQSIFYQMRNGKDTLENFPNNKNDVLLRNGTANIEKHISKDIGKNNIYIENIDNKGELYHKNIKENMNKENNNNKDINAYNETANLKNKINENELDEVEKSDINKVNIKNRENINDTELNVYINNEKELNALLFLSLVVENKKYHNILFKYFPDIVYNFIYKFNFFLLHTFEKISMSEFILPPHFLSPYNEKQNITITQFVICDKKKIKEYMKLYISFFFLFNSICFENKLSYEWDELIQNTLKSINLISSIKFKNEVEIITRKITTIEYIDKEVMEERRIWKFYINIIIYFITYYIDMIEYIIAMRKLPLEELDFNDFVKNLFLFYKCYEIVNENEKETKKIYYKIWDRICSFLMFILNFDYFEKKTYFKLMIINTFFIFTYEFTPKKQIEKILKKCFVVIKEKDTFLNFLENFKNNNDVTSYMKESQIKNIENILDIILTNDKSKK